MVFHTRTIRRTTTANKNDTVLLDIMAYTDSLAHTYQLITNGSQPESGGDRK